MELHIHHIEIPIIGFNNVYTSSFGRINQSKSLVLNPTCISSFFFFFKERLVSIFGKHGSPYKTQLLFQRSSPFNFFFIINFSFFYKEGSVIRNHYDNLVMQVVNTFFP